MKTIIEHEDVELIAERVAAILKPFLAPKDKPEDRIFSVDELAAYLRVSPKFIYDHAREYKPFKVGGLLRFWKHEVDKAIALQKKYGG